MEKSLLQQFYDVLGFTLTASLAALFGSVAALAFIKGITLRQAIFVVFAGLGLGSYGGAALVAYFQLPSVAAGLISFLLAALAMPILGFLFAVASRLNKRADRVADAAIERVAGPQTPDKPEEPKP